MALFKDCCVVLDLKNIPYKEKKKVMSAVLDNGGNISYVVNQKCSFVVASSLENMSSSRQRSSQKHQIPIVGLQYVWSCQEKGLLLPFTEHVLNPLPSSQLTPETHPVLRPKGQPWSRIEDVYQENTRNQNNYTHVEKFRIYKNGDYDIPEFPSNFQVAKYVFFCKPKMWSVLELQSAKSQTGQQYRIVNSVMNEAEKTVSRDKLVYCIHSEDAVEAYLMLSKELPAQGFIQTPTLPSWAEKLASPGLQQVLLEEKLNCEVSQEVGVFLELIWTEALGSLSSILTVPVTSLSLNDVSRVEGLLLQVQKCPNDDEVSALLDEVKTLLPVRMAEPDSRNKLVSQKLDLCQLIRDILNMTEATLGNPFPSSLGKYRALKCSIEQVSPESPEFLSVSQLLEDGHVRPATVQQILRVNRGAELHMFQEELGNNRTLLHSTASSSFVGILSRGLLLPKTGVEQHGIQRTDVGNLGGGIYFSDSISTSLKYSKPSEANGSRMLLVCEVALGKCKDLHHRDVTLTRAPEGYDSVHGVRCTKKMSSDFEDDEYVVYSTDQVRLKYVVQYVLEGDNIKDFQPLVTNAVQLLDYPPESNILTSDDGEGLGLTKNPLEEVTAGLLDSSGKTLPLKAVHVRCKLMDLLSQVIIFQTYTNSSDVPIEAKYVFPLEETAAVCGFEAFINGKHVIGKVKEKEQARKEYKQAIERGHGAYLMDQDAPDVFTISVGNLPPGATVLIKVTFITELVVRAGIILFSLPGSVAPWQQSAALNQRTQTTVDKVCVNELQTEGEFSLSMSIEMPYEITELECSHQIKIKRTDCKAVVSTLPNQTFNADGFRLSFSLSNIHMPRMWVEKHPEKDTEACMLVFYPDFVTNDASLSEVSDVVIMLDTSESMRGEPMLNARRIALKVLNTLDRSVKVNVFTFGTDSKEAFPSANVLQDNFEEAKNFIMTSDAVGGSTELWRPLRSLNLLPPSHGLRNVLLLSDGHVQNQPQTLQLVRDNAKHTRFFTCGLSPTANRYMLRALAQAGGGAYEFFDTKTKHTWAEKVHSQVRYIMSPGCNSVAVKWQQFNLIAPPPVQAPSQLCALFNDCHTVVYGFVPHCTQATLFGDLSGQEIKTMVSTTELQKTKGTFLHKLTARAIIRDYEDGSLSSNEAEHEGKKVELKSYIIELSKEFSILSQFTSFVAVEERDQDQPDTGFTDVPKILAEEDVDILPYMGWSEEDPVRSAEEIVNELLDESEEMEEVDCRSIDDNSLQLFTASYRVSPDKSKDLFSDLNVASQSVMASSTMLSSRMKSCKRRLKKNKRSNLFDDEEDLGYAAFDDYIPTPNQVETDGYIHPENDMAMIFPRSESRISMYRECSDAFAMASSSLLPPPPPPPPGFSFSSMTSSSVSPMPEMVQQHQASIPAPFSTSPLLMPFGSGGFNNVPVVAKASNFWRANLGAPSFSSDIISPPPPPPAFSAPCTTNYSVPHELEMVQRRQGSIQASFPSSSSLMSFGPPPPAFSASCSTNYLVPQKPAMVPQRQATIPAFLSAPSSMPLGSDDFNNVPVVGTSVICSGVRASSFVSKKMSPAPLPAFRAGSAMCRSMRRRRDPTLNYFNQIDWDQLFALQHQDGYWECNGMLSRFLGLDVDYFANVFLKEKGICSLGPKAHADVLRLLATMLVLQLMRVKKMTGAELFQTLLRLTDNPEPRPAHWDAVKKAVQWARMADKQYPCVCSRLEIGWDWESCTRQLLGLDSLPPFSPLIHVLQRNRGLVVM